MREIQTLLFFVVMFFAIAPHAQADVDRDLIRKRLIQQIYDSVPQESRATWQAKEIKKWCHDQRPDGSYAEVDYVSTDKPDWGLLDNLGRALSMVMAARLEGSPFYRDPEMDRRALLSIHYAASRKWDHINWWHKEIGLPLKTYKLLLLFEDQMPEEDRDFVMALTRKAHLIDHPSHWAARGQNLIWYAQLTIALGVLYERSDWIEVAADGIAKEIDFDHQQGIKEDYSFFQHGDLYYSGGYGLGFSVDAAKLLLLLQDTAFELSGKTYDILANYVLDGQLWIVHHKVLDYSSTGRYYARYGAGDSKGLLGSCEAMALLRGPKQNEFKKCAQTLKDGSETGRVGNKMFWVSDFMTQNRSNFGISVRMFSQRTVNGDTSPLGEGLKSQHLSDGLTYFYRSGEEYWDIFPLWDFKRLPGTTEEHMAVYPEVPKNDYWPSYGLTSFVGGVSDGENGASAMNFLQGNLSAKKAWFFHEKGMVALGANVNCVTCKHVITSINQEWSKSEMKKGLEPQSHQQWVYANQMGYLISDQNQLVAQDQFQVGSWRSLDVNKSTDMVRGKVTSLWIEHGAQVKDGHYAYSVYPQMPENEFLQLAKKPDYEVLSNTDQIQAVHFANEKMVQSIFYREGKVNWSHGKSWIEVDENVAVQMREKDGHLTLSVSSPDRTVLSVTVSWSWHGKKGREVVYLHEKPYAGASVTLTVH